MIWKSLGITQFVMEYHKEGDVSALSKNWRARGLSICRVLKKAIAWESFMEILSDFLRNNVLSEVRCVMLKPTFCPYP